MERSPAAGNCWGCLLFGLLVSATTAVAADEADMAAAQGAGTAAAAPHAGGAAGSNVRLFVQALLQLCQPDSALLQEAVAAAAASAQLTAGAGSGISSSWAAPQCHPAWCALFRHRMREFTAAALYAACCPVAAAAGQLGSLGRAARHCLPGEQTTAFHLLSCLSTCCLCA